MTNLFRIFVFFALLFILIGCGLKKPLASLTEKNYLSNALITP